MKHGTYAGYQQHQKQHSRACPECQRAASDYQLRRQRRKGVLPRPPAECGTPSGYNRHLTLGQPTCDECRRAHADWQRRHRYGTLRPPNVPAHDCVICGLPLKEHQLFGRCYQLSQAG